jgi:alanine adding enzyme
MRQLSFGPVEPADFDALSGRHPQGNFQQTTAMGQVREAQGVEVRYLGVREDGELLAAAALELHRGRLSTFAAVHDGPLCDFHDQELTSVLFDGLRSEARRRGAAQLEITPEQPYELRDSLGQSLVSHADGAKRPAGVPAEASAGPDTRSFETICQQGFVHAGFDRQYNAVPRWRYVKDLTGLASEDELLASYTKNTRRDLRIAHESFVRVERVGRDRLPEYHAICELSAEKQGFENRPLSYFELLFDTLGDTAEFIVASIDMPAYLALWERKRDELQATIDRLEAQIAPSGDEAQGQFRSHRKAERQLRDAREKHASALKRVEQSRRAIEEQGARIPAAAALFVWHPRECVYLFSGSDARHAAFCAPTAIQHRMMCACLERGVTRYNFYGINGVFDDPHDAGRGLLEFKQGFGGYVEELMGSFTLPVRPLAYGLKQLGHRLLGR